jgi:hypothetical protein
MAGRHPSVVPDERNSLTKDVGTILGSNKIRKGNRSLVIVSTKKSRAQTSAICSSITQLRWPFIQIPQCISRNLISDKRWELATRQQKRAWWLSEAIWVPPRVG